MGFECRIAVMSSNRYSATFQRRDVSTSHVPVVTRDVLESAIAPTEGETSHFIEIPQ